LCSLSGTGQTKHQ